MNTTRSKKWLIRVSVFLAAIALHLGIGRCLEIHAASEFVIRNSPPDASNKYYYDSNYNANAGGQFAMPNCTTYVLGRIYEITGKRCNLSGNAKEYFEKNKISGTYEYSTDPYSPALGAILCFTNSGNGHVAIVEEIGTDSGGKYICVSESNYSGRYSGKETKRFNYVKYYLSDLNGFTSSNSEYSIRMKYLEDNDGYAEEYEGKTIYIYPFTFQGYIYCDKEASIENIDNTRIIDAGATEVTDTTAKISATVSPYGTVTECGFYFGTSPENMQKYVENTTTKDCASVFYTLGTGKWTAALSKGTTYYYQIYGIIGGVTYKTSVGSFTTTGDSVQPVIESISVTNVSSEGYTVEVVATDNVGVAKVCCPTWTLANEQDDLTQNWKTNTIATNVSGNTYVYRVNISDHNNERGIYTTHVYAYDMNGNTAFTDLLVEVPEPIVSVTGVSLNNHSLSLEVAGTSTLTAAVSPSNATNKTVTWTSSNTSVATVTNGVVKAVAPGTATITVKTADGNKTATCAVTVKAKTVSVSSVALNKTSVSLTVDETETLTATVNPSNATNKTVTWTSSNTSVATVTNGTVKAIAPGTATITVKTADGNKTATCAVTVKAKTVSVSSVALNKTSVSLTVDETETLTATVSPSNATNKTVTWTSSNTSVATVTNGVIKAVAPGTATITVKTVDGKHTTTCSVTVKDVVADVDAPTIAVSNVKGTAGETITVTVSLENNPGFAFLSVKLTYSEDLTLVEASNLSNLTFTSDTTMVWDDILDCSTDGELLKLTFEISEEAEIGEHYIKVNFIEAYTADLADVVFTTVDGYVDVTDFVYGDANNDGVVNGKDVILIRRYVAAKDPVTGESSVEVTTGADANGDGVCNGKDVILIRRYVAARDPITGESSVVLGPTK